MSLGVSLTSALCDVALPAGRLTCASPQGLCPPSHRGRMPADGCSGQSMARSPKGVKQGKSAADLLHLVGRDILDLSHVPTRAFDVFQSLIHDPRARGLERLVIGMLPDPKASEKSQKRCDHDEGEDPKDRPDSLPFRGRREEVSLRDHRLESLTINDHHGFRQESGSPSILRSIRHFHYCHSPFMCCCEGSVPPSRSL